jgi:hypothetical protein
MRLRRDICRGNLEVRPEGGGFVARVEIEEGTMFFGLEQDAAAVFDHQ